MSWHKQIEYYHAPSEAAKTCLLYPLSAGYCVNGVFPAAGRLSTAVQPFRFHMIMSGSGCLEANGQTRRLRNGHVFVTKASDVSTYASDTKEGQLLWILFAGVTAGPYFELLEPKQLLLFELPTERLQRVGQAAQEILRLMQYRPPSIEVRCSLLLTQIWSELLLEQMEGTDGRGMEQGDHTCDEIYAALRYMEEYFNEPLRLEEVAKAAGMSTSHFARRFKKSTGYTVMEYVIKQRLAQAKKLLAATQLPISEVAEQAGFQDQSYFTRIFKRDERMTPKQYREMQLSD